MMKAAWLLVRIEAGISCGGPAMPCASAFVLLAIHSGFRYLNVLLCISNHIASIRVLGIAGLTSLLTGAFARLADRTR